MGDAVIDRPLIGVSTSEVRIAERITPTPEGDPPDREMALGMKYLRAIEAAGGVPVVMPPLELEAVGPLLDRLAGVCLSGGPDLDPAAYTTRRHPRLGPTEPDLDRFELAIASAADRRGLPMLAICRGTQALNVVRGGTLIQHLPDHQEGPDAIPHRQQNPGREPSHPVTIEPGSLLAKTIGGDRVDVNSFHHQAIDRLGGDLVVTARAVDGTIEAVEDPSRPFLIGVQWHAELLAARPEEQALFSAFASVAGSGDRAAGKTTM